MPPRTRNAARLALPEALPSTEPVRKRRKVKKPLQDVTESYIASHHNSPVKVKSHRKSPETKIPSKDILSSPLPPSSPIPISSAPDAEALGQCSGRTADSTDYPESIPYYSEHEEATLPVHRPSLLPDEDFQFDTGQQYSAGGGHTSENQNLDNSDIFGFFAVERELKERPVRFTRPVAPEVWEERSHIPPTPHKSATYKRKASSSPAQSESPSLASSPSPQKPSTSRLSNATMAIDISFAGDDLADVATPKPRRSTRSWTSGRHKKPRIEPIGPVDLSSSPPRTPAGETQEAGPSKSVPRKAARQKARLKPSSSRRPRAKKTSKIHEIEDEMEEEDPEFVAERQKRIEYFKQLEAYTVATEDVYLV